ncbi:MAG TPA: DUF3987 domain-containing protein, partial [Gemmataceae bacterium]
RPGKPRSHRYYLVPIASIPDWAVSTADQGAPAAVAAKGHAGPFLKHFKHATTNKGVIDFIGTGGQVVCPPAAHDSGERRVWYDEAGNPSASPGEPAVVAFVDLWNAVCDLAAACGASLPKREQVPLAAPPSIPSRSGLRLSTNDTEKRAAAYLKKIDGAVEGQGGHARTFAAARAMVYGFDLGPEAGFRLMRDEFNPRCNPPWSEKDLWHKVKDADRLPFSKPRGWLRDQGVASRATSLDRFDRTYKPKVVRPPTSQPVQATSRQPHGDGPDDGNDRLGDAHEGQSAQPGTKAPNHKQNDGLSSFVREKFPVEVLPRVVRTFVAEVAADMQCDPVAVALPVLSVLGGAIGTKRQVCLKQGKAGWYETPVVWTAAVAPSGMMKTPPWKLAMRPVRDIEEALREDNKLALEQWEDDCEKAEKKNKKKPPKPKDRQLMISDVTIESAAIIVSENPDGVLLCRDELSGWVESMGQYKTGKSSSDLSSWLSTHDAGFISVNRKSSGDSIYVPRAAVSITGTIQPGVLQSIMTRRHRSSGLLARLVLAEMEPVEDLAWSNVSAVRDDTYDAYTALVKDLYHLPEFVSPLTAEADRVWGAYWAPARKAAEHAGGDIGAMRSKMIAFTARYALIHNTAANPRDRSAVGAESIRAAITLSEWFRREQERLYAKLAATGGGDDAALLAFIREQPEQRATPRTVHRWNRDLYPTSEAAELAMRKLDKVGRWVTVQTGGRQSTYFEAPPG